jgi:tetratricopeptide (TPR) repeat protein
MTDSKQMHQRLGEAIGEALNGRLKNSNLDLVDVVQIPKTGDRMVRLRTLEEALEDFDQEDAETTSYIVHLKKRQPDPSFPEDAASVAASPRPAEPAETMYLANGKLNTGYLFRNAELLAATGDYQLARNIYRAVLQSGERSAQALFGTARCFEAEGRLDEARIKYEESLAYQAMLESYQHLAAILIRQSKEQPAAEVFERALNMKELPLKTRYELHKASGNCWLRAGNSENAEKHYRKALAIDPTADEIPANIGALYLQAGKVAEARRCFQDSIAANPRNGRALMGIASCCLAEGDKRTAHDYFARSLECELNNATAVFHLVKCAYDIKSYATAARLVEEYTQVAPINAHLLYSLAGLQFHLGRMADVNKTIRRIFEIAPEHAGAKDLLSRIS